MRDEHKEIANRLRELEATTDDLDARIRQLQNDLDDHIENLEAWDRFEGLAGPDKYSGAQDRKQQLGLRYDT